MGKVQGFIAFLKSKGDNIPHLSSCKDNGNTTSYNPIALTCYTQSTASFPVKLSQVFIIRDHKLKKTTCFSTVRKTQEDGWTPVFSAEF